MTSITDTPEIRLAFQVNAPGSLIPTVQLRALVEAVERVRRLASALESQAKFADHDIAAHQRDTARRIRGALASPDPPVGGNESNGSSRRDELKPPSGSALKPTPPPEVARLVEEAREAVLRMWIDAEHTETTDATAAAQLITRLAEALQGGKG